MKLLGVDPSMSGTGLVALEVTTAAGLDRAQLLWRWTIRPRKGASLLERIAQLQERVFLDLASLEPRQQDPNGWALVCENPTDFTMAPPKPGQPDARVARYKSSAVLGAAVGAVICGLIDALGYFNDSHVYLVDSRTWLPRTRNGAGGVHAMKHVDAAASLRRQHRALAPCNDDELMAAGVALWWYRHQRTTIGVARWPET